MCGRRSLPWWALVLAASRLAAAKDSLDRGVHVFATASGALRWSPVEEEQSSDGAIVYGYYDDAIASNGTGRLDLRTTGTASDAKLFEAIGFAEGLLTAGRIVQQVHNTLGSPSSPAVMDFLAQNHKFIERQIEELGETDPYWRVVGLLKHRERGLAEGLRQGIVDLTPHELGLAAAGNGADATVNATVHHDLKSMSSDQLSMVLLQLTLVSDLDEIGRATAYSANEPTTLTERRLSSRTMDLLTGASGHCTALIKRAGERLLIGHATWSSFSEMLRIWKDIRLPHVADPAIQNRRISFSSYPGYLASTDDWLVLPDKQMVVLETTLDCMDDSRLAEYVTPETLNTPLRSLVASMLATTPEHWTSTFSRYNSGTQNNQWMVVSLSAWRDHVAHASSPSSPSSQTPSGILWVLEQQPGLIQREDMTSVLLEQSYWSSYNVPYFNETMRVSQYMDKRTSVCACEAQREFLLAKAQADVTTLTSLQSLLTTNDWQHEPLSWNCPKCAIASRFDIDGRNISIGAEFPKNSGVQDCGGFMLNGAIDAKAADDTMLSLGESLFVPGPPKHGVAAFSWSKAPLPAQASSMPKHVGHPDEWNFPWQKFGGELSEDEDWTLLELMI